MRDRGKLGRTYGDGEVVCAQGEPGCCMFVVQQGEVEILAEENGAEVLLGVAGKDELLGEMSILLRANRCATLRARGPARVLTVDKQTLLRRLHQDPGLAFRLLETMARRIRQLDRQVLELTSAAQRTART